LFDFRYLAAFPLQIKSPVALCRTGLACAARPARYPRFRRADQSCRFHDPCARQQVPRCGGRRPRRKQNRRRQPGLKSENQVACQTLNNGMNLTKGQAATVPDMFRRAAQYLRIGERNPGHASTQRHRNPRQYLAHF